MQKRTAIITGITAGAALLVGLGVVVALTATPASETSAPPAAASASPTAPAPTADPTEDAAEPPAEGYDTEAALVFLIEEEKLAHDVYVTLGDLWGSNIFPNIAASETTHQDLVLPLLDERAIADPRSTEVGVFTDPALQALYDELVASGSQSLDDAIEAGIAIEEKDITDLSVAISSEDEADVISVLERLLAGSENHLRSFERLS